jgi:HD-like signal output (HDOD) protein
MLGFVTVRTLVITCSLVTRFKTTQGIDLKQFWRYCLSTAVAAKWLATETGEDPELAFTIGIIHALGELMLHLGLPEQVMTLDKITSVYSENRLQMERDVFGFSYADATAELIARWQFPDVIVSAIRAFSRPIDADSLNRQGAILYLAALLARHAELKVPKNAQRSAGAAQVAELLGLKPNVIFDAMPSVDELRAGLENLMP